MQMEPACNIKVCHVTSAHGVYDTRIYRKECVSLAAAGYEVALVAVNARDEVRDGVRIYGVPCAFRHRLGRMLKSPKCVYGQAKALKADIYHLHDPELLPYALKLKRQGARVIFDSHEDIFRILYDRPYVPSWLRRLAVPVLNRYMAFILRRLDALISVTPHICGKLARYNACTVMCTNYPLLVPPIDRTSGAVAPRNLVFAGTMAEFWNQERILDAIRDIDCRYLLAGSGPEAYLRKLQAHPQWRKVQYFGRIAWEEVWDLYRRSALGVAVSLYRANLDGKTGSLGCIKIFEFMMAGLPVLCSDLVLWKEIVEREQCGICVDPTDTAAIGRAIDYLLSHPDEARRMGENGRRAAERTYNWQSQVPVLLDLYRRLSGHAPGSRRDDGAGGPPEGVQEDGI